MILQDQIPSMDKSIQDKTGDRLSFKDPILKCHWEGYLFNDKTYEQMYKNALNNHIIPEIYAEVLCHVIHFQIENDMPIPGYELSVLDYEPLLDKLANYPNWLITAYNTLPLQMLEDYRISFGVINHYKGVQDSGT